MTDTTHDLDTVPPNWERGDCMQTFTGRQFFPNDPRPEEFDIIDIAHALSMICRYGGHVDRFYSVAEHAVHVSEYLEPLYGPFVAFQGLMHDASEAYLNDMVRPVKLMLPDYQAMELKVEAAIAIAFNLPETLDPAVKDADTRILYDERTALLKPPPVPWRTDSEPLGVMIRGWSPATAEFNFRARYGDLRSQVPSTPA